MRELFLRATARIKRIGSQEGGFAVPISLLMLIGATAVVSIGVISSIQVQEGSVRDRETKSALSVAESGVSQALLHFNRIPPNANPCSPVTSSPPDGAGWCPPVTGGLNGGIFTYSVRPLAGAIEVVSASNVDGVARRIHVTAHSSSGQSVFQEATVMGKDLIHMDANAEVRAGAATNGDIVLESNAKQCGAASVGIGRSLTMTGNAGYYSDQQCATQATTPNQEELNLPPVNQGDAATVNDNGRFFSLDLISGNKTRACWNGLNGYGQTSANCGARQLDIRSNAAVTLGGAKYSFCKLTLSSNTSLYIQAGKTVTIYFDSPEACGYPSGTTQLDMSSNSRITATDGGPANVALLFVGSSSLQTKINLSSNTSIGAACQQNFVVYAPLTDILLNSDSTYCGALAGNTLELDSNARVYTDNSAQNYVLPNTAAHYEVDRFVECSAAPTSPPNAGC
jgi:hypothetical protein